MRHEQIHRLLENAYRACSIGVFTPNEMHMSPETFRHFMLWKVQSLDPRKLLARFTDRAAGHDLAFVMASFETAGARLDVKLDEGVVVFVNTRHAQDPMRALSHSITIPTWVRVEQVDAGKAVPRVGPEGQFHVDVELDGTKVHCKSLDSPISTTVTIFGGFTLGLRTMVAKMLPKSMWPKVKFTISGSARAGRVIAEADYTWDSPVFHRTPNASDQVATGPVVRGTTNHPD